ncbi:MAG: hypothetical protein ABIO70_20120 [Pseudomonadota bacterium]
MLDPCPPSVGQADPTTAPPDPNALHARLCKLVQTERRALRELALGLAAMDRDRLYRPLGYAGLVEYAEQALDLGPSMARQLARLGRRLPMLPALDAAFAGGALGWTKARTLAQVVTPATEAGWVARALTVSSRELEEQVCRVHPGDRPPEGPPDPESPRYLWARLRLDPFHFERLMHALAEARHHLEDLDLSVSQLLLFLAEEWLAQRTEVPEGAPGVGEVAHVCQASSGLAPGDTGAAAAPGDAGTLVVAGQGEGADPGFSAPVPWRIVVHRCSACERAWAEGRAGAVELDPRDLALATCDAEQVAADGAAGVPGQVARSIPPAVRRRVLVRDGGRCQVPGCRNRRHVEVHHLRPRAEGGGHGPENLLTLCSCHHDMVHRGVIQLARGPNGELRCARGPGEPLGVVVSIHGERAELEQADLAAFGGPPGSWGCIREYWGAIEPPVGAPPRGRQQVRLGDEARMAPAWMARAVRC